MKIWVPNQTDSDETRVAMVPSVVKRLADPNVQIVVEAGAGAGAHQTDDAFEHAGAMIASVTEAGTHWADADMTLTIGPISTEQAGTLKPKSLLVGMLAPMKHIELIAALAAQNVTTFSMEFLPRISRAQAADVLSSQANMAGYVSVILAARQCPKIFPMMMTAAGTIAPSKIFVIGAGVAGLQAIATAKRLGARVEAYDVRPVVKEQVESLGARFVELPARQADALAQGGYACEQTDEQREKQQELMAKTIIAADCVIATAAIFGKAPPLLIDHDVVAQMHAGDVIVDMAADTDTGRGNCAATQPGQTVVTDQGVTVVGETNLPGLVPAHASLAYANNMRSFLTELFDDNGNLAPDMNDELIKGPTITHDGQVVNEMVKNAMSESN
jgi:NAD(P) transhydrogenase subunit alpha